MIFPIGSCVKPEILTAIIAASSALGGVIISQAISITLSIFDKKHQKHKLLRQKYEEMMFHFQDSLLYYNQVATCRTLDQLLQQTHSVPAQKALGLALLYFPNLESSFDNYVRSLVAYYDLICSVYNPDIQANAGAQARVHHKSELHRVENKLFDAKNEVITLLKLNAKKYTKA